MLDTSTVILLGRIDDPADLPDESMISAITLANCRLARMSPRATKSARHTRRICSTRSRTSTCWCSMPSLRAHLGQLPHPCERPVESRRHALRCTDRPQCHCLWSAALQMQSVRFRRDPTPGPESRPAPRSRQAMSLQRTSPKGLWPNNIRPGSVRQTREWAFLASSDHGESLALHKFFVDQDRAFRGKHVCLP